MQRLRNATVLARFVLAWFALTLGIAVASPLAHPQGLQLLCSASGSVKLSVNTGDAQPVTAHTMDCPLCASVAAPPPLSQPGRVVLSAPRSSAPVGVASWPAAAAGAPLPARGPPLRALV